MRFRQRAVQVGRTVAEADRKAAERAARIEEQADRRVAERAARIAVSRTAVRR